MYALIALPASAVALTAFWAITSRRQSKDDCKDALELAETLTPYTVQLDEETLWNQKIGGISGCRKIYRSAVQMVRAARYLPNDQEAIARCKNDLLFKSWLLYILTRVAIYWEAPLKATILPSLPRMMAWSVARLYCDMADTYTVMVTLQVQSAVSMM